MLFQHSVSGRRLRQILSWCFAVSLMLSLVLVPALTYVKWSQFLKLHAERNQFVLVKLALQDYRENHHRLPELSHIEQGECHSWRKALVPTLVSLAPPGWSQSELGPEAGGSFFCRAADRTFILAVTREGEFGPWHSSTDAGGMNRPANQSIIAISSSGFDIDWRECTDIQVTKKAVLLRNHSGDSQQIEKIGDFHTLRIDGTIDFHGGEHTAEQFRSMLNGD